jgi:hypothetical protein
MKKWFMLVAGAAPHRHQPTGQAQPVMINPGEAVESELDLAEAFAGKFVECDAPTAPAPAPAADPAAPKGKGRGKGPTKPPANPTTAPTVTDDVTAQFPVAVTAGLLVRGTEANGFNYYEPDSPTEAINPVPLDRAGLEAELVAYTAPPA